ncbi:hypothetical protein Ndes2526B_g02839 [Nannochloris sp. 'desiccata']|nr:hypothetical protein KSW81_006896 [Chlorella desiccata (nom. nud.)]KAH7622014.1 putative Alpha-ketoglutarate-dependent dioxygenase alkB-like protein 6 [Chlorella desiccata (nom. nud.)]
MASSIATGSLEHYKIGPLPSLYLIPDYISHSMGQHFLTNILATQSGWKHVSGRRLLNIGGVVSSKGSLLQAPMPSWGLQSLITEISGNFHLYGGAPANHVLINSYSPGQGIMSHQDGPLYCPVVAILSLGAPAIIRFTKKRKLVDDDGTEEEEVPSHSNVAKNCSRSDVLATVSVVLPPRSLFIFKDDAYEQYLHGIDFVEEEIVDDSVVNPQAENQKFQGSGRGDGEMAAEATIATVAPPVLKRDGTRVSLTIRRVLKVHNLGLLRR